MTISWNPCFAMIRWRPIDSFCCISVRPGPPYRDWVLTRNHPMSYDELVSESHFHHRCALFGAQRDAASQTDEAVTIEILNPVASPSSRDSPSSGVVTASQNAVMVRWKVPPPAGPVRAPPVFEASRSCQFSAEASTSVFSPKPAGAMPVIHVIHHCHVSDTFREQFSGGSFLTDPRLNYGQPRRPPPRHNTPLYIDGPVVQPHPLDSRPSPPTSPPIDMGPKNLPYRGIRFLYTVGAQELRDRLYSPGTSAPRSIQPNPPPTDSPETNPDLRGANVLFAEMVAGPCSASDSECSW